MMSFPREPGGRSRERKSHEMIFGSVTFHIFREREGGGRRETAQPPTMRSQSSTRCS